MSVLGEDIRQAMLVVFATATDVERTLTLPDFPKMFRWNQSNQRHQDGQAGQPKKWEVPVKRKYMAKLRSANHVAVFCLETTSGQIHHRSLIFGRYAG
ncbi:unnamed protein product [Pleuronectes platessa]|uniref:Uncharacterized protein n=1 Tax=Pleuronectes platessa TaxID=8262 RepID=A0A9N7VPX2_PLEPL|nr:unnamed protein product [Pleuronectes platessa]